MLTDRETLLSALGGVRLGAVVLLLVALSFALYKPLPSNHGPITDVVVKVVRARTAAILALASIAAATYFFDGGVLVVTAVVTHVWEGHTEQWRWLEYTDVAGLAAFAGLLIIGSFKETRGIDIWTRPGLTFFAVLAVAVDAAQLALISLTADFAPPASDTTPDLHVPNILHLSSVAARLLFLLPFLVVLVSPRTSYVNAHDSHANIVDDSHASQSSFLLPPSPSRTATYGTFAHHQPSPSGTVTPVPSEQGPPHTGSRKLPFKPTPKKEVELDPSWTEIGRRLRRVLPYLWPSRSVKLQSLAVICVILVIVGRFVNVGIPFSLGSIVQNLDGWRGGGPSPWPPLFLYVALRWGASALATFEELLWQPIMQYSDREMAQLSFNHILNLSLSFHTHRKTGEVLRALDRGYAINHVFELVLFSIVPTILDIIVGLVVFYLHFEATLSFVIGAVFVAYITASITLTSTRTKLRRKMNDADVAIRGIHTDCLLNYETVKYFSNEPHEHRRYRDAVLKYQSLEYKVIAYLNVLNIVQNTIMCIGLLVGSAIVALRVVRNNESATNFVIFVAYLAQLYTPLNNLGSIYRSLNQSLVDTEKLLKLLDEPVEVQDKPGAPDLVVTGGEIEFENVSFSYGNNGHALRGVSFKVGKGQSVALVGQTGSGKSTALRLLYRFYDLGEGEGRILIDGQDIREVTQASLRKSIGVVPQDSVLFNSTIEYNIRYGKLDADYEEVVAASRAAQMHDKILSFQDGYQTTVGERGVRLSGGELQRVAIARTLLKNPPVLLLDEATSALDTNTERDIQNALQNLMQGRSSLSIAHRLSTIAAADLILVLKDGEIIESGNIRELLAQNGEFASMWAEQVKTDEDAQLYASMSEAKAEAVEARTYDKPEGYILDEAIPDEAVVLPGTAAYGDTISTRSARKDQLDIDEPIRAESPLPIVLDSEHGHEPATIEKTYAEALTTESADPNAPSVKDLAFTSEQTPAKTDTAPITASPQDIGDKPLSFPGSADDSSGRRELSFPGGGDDISVRREGSIAGSTRTPGTPSGHPAAISFSPETERPPSRTATPDGEESPQMKRTRTMSQNLSKFAKRMSLGVRRQSSMSSPPAQAEPSGSGSGPPTPTRNSSDFPASPSPAGSADEAGGSIRGSKLSKRKVDTLKEDKAPRRRTTLSFSRPKQPKPEAPKPESPNPDSPSQA